jgi:drug/metabolite transporter (DMT)-like permease
MLILLNYILVNIIWGIEPIVNKFFLKHISIPTLMLIISIFYLICVMIVAYKNKNKLKTDLIKLRNYKSLILLIAIATILFMTANYGYLYLVSNQKAAIVAILTAIYPILTLILGYKYFNETLTKYEFIGFMLVLLGIFFINYKN